MSGKQAISHLYVTVLNTAFGFSSPLHNAPRGELSECPITCQAKPNTRFRKRWSRAGESIVSGGALSFSHIFLFALKIKMWSRRMARNGARGAIIPAKFQRITSDTINVRLMLLRDINKTY